MRVIGENGNYREKTFIVKKFKEDPQQAAEIAFNNYAALKAAGVRMWTTYRIDKDTGTILMSDGESAQDYLLTYNNESNSKQAIRHAVTEIVNLDEAINGAVESAIKAAENCILFTSLENPDCADSWMARFSKRNDNGSFSLDCFVGDLDSIDLTYVPQKESAADEDKAYLAYVNVGSLRKALLAILKEVLDPDVEQKYCDEFTAKIADIQRHLDKKLNGDRN